MEKVLEVIFVTWPRPTWLTECTELLSVSTWLAMNSLNSLLFFLRPCPVRWRENKTCRPGRRSSLLSVRSLSWYFWCLYSMISLSKGCLTSTALTVLLSGWKSESTAHLRSRPSGQGVSYNRLGEVSKQYRKNGIWYFPTSRFKNIKQTYHSWL